MTEPTNYTAKDTTNQHTRNPGWQPGNHWVNCHVCGFNLRANDAKTRWDGAIVCPKDWEPRHPQDFVRGRSEDTSAKGLVNPEN